MFLTHPPLVFIHFIGLAFFSISLEKSLMLFPTHEVLDIFTKYFIHLWGFCYILVSQPFELYELFSYNSIFLWGITIYVHYYSSLFNGRIHTNIHLFIHVIQSLFFSLFFMCMLVRILSSKIYFLCFFLASLHIALIYYFYIINIYIYISKGSPCIIYKKDLT